MKKSIIAATLLLNIGLHAQQYSHYLYNAPPVDNPVTKPGYTLIFQDEFDGPLSVAENPGGSENFYNAGPIFVYPGDMDKITWTTRPENLYLSTTPQDGTVLNMVTRKETTPYNVPWIWQAYPNENNNGAGYDFPVTSSYIKTNRDYKYGYFEISAKLPMGPRLWPAFWLFGQRNFTGGCGHNACEIDVFEIFTPVYGTTNRLGSNIGYTEEVSGNCYRMGHQSCVDGNSPYQPYCQPVGAGHQGQMYPWALTDDDLRNSYNTYAVEWSPTEIKFYFNNVCYFTETGVVPTNEIVERMRVLIGTGLQYYDLNSSISDMLSAMQPSATMSIKYLRIYKKNPTVVADPNNCRTGTLIYTASTGIAGDTYSWSFDHPNWVTNITFPNSPSHDKISFQLLPAYQSNTIEITVAATGGAPYEVSTHKFRAPDLNSDFTTGTPLCNSNGISFTATAAAVTPGSMWDIYAADQYGTITNTTSLQTGFGNTMTFNTGLVADGYYVIKHGVWKSSGTNVCIGWSETTKLVQVKLSDFTVSVPWCGKTGFSVTATAATNASGSMWQLYPCDRYGTITNWNNPVVQYGNVTTFYNLPRDSYYKIKHGSWGNCGSWTESWKQVYIPDLLVEPDFHISSSTAGNGTVTYQTTPIWNQLTGFNHYWAIFNSDAAGNTGMQIGAVQSTSNATFSGLNPAGYYVIKHGVYDNCSSWNERRYVVHGNSWNILRTAGDSVANTPMIFPNPTTGSFTIQTDEVADEVTVTDMLGRIVFTTKPQSTTVLIDLSTEAEGVYLVTTVAGVERRVSRVVVEH